MSGRTVGQSTGSTDTTSSSCASPDHSMYFSQAASVLSNFSVAMNQGIILEAHVSPVPRQWPPQFYRTIEGQLPTSQIIGELPRYVNQSRPRKLDNRRRKQALVFPGAPCPICER